MAREYLQASEELDEILGLLRPGSIIVLEGRPGTGKSTYALSLSYRNIVENKAKTLYITFGETPDKLYLRCKKLGLNIKSLADKGLFRIIWLPMMRGKELVDFVTKTIFEEGVGKKYDIIVIDSVTPILKLLKDYESQRAWLQTVVYHFFSQAEGILVLVADVLGRESPELMLLEYIADIVLELGYVLGPLGSYERNLTIMKHRFAPLATASYPFEITTGGIRVLSHVSQKKKDTFFKKRKNISVLCKALRNVLGDELKPGTQLFIINRRPGKAFPYKLYLFLSKRLLELIEQGYKITAFTYGPVTPIDFMYEHLKRRDKELSEDIKKCLEKHVHVEFLDPLATAPSMITSREQEIVENLGTDLLLLWNLENAMESAGYEKAKPFILYAIKYYKDMGITVIRYYENVNPYVFPWAQLLWNDIIIELDVDSAGKTIIRARRRGLPATEIYDDELEECLKGV